jgi:hypothetical protein
MTYHPTPEQHRAEDHKHGFRGCGHYDTGTVIALSNDPARRPDCQWSAVTETMLCCGSDPDNAIRNCADFAADCLRKSGNPSHMANYAATLAAAQQLTGYVPRAIARRGKR